MTCRIRRRIAPFNYSSRFRAHHIKTIFFVLFLGWTWIILLISLRFRAGGWMKPWNIILISILERPFQSLCRWFKREIYILNLRNTMAWCLWNFRKWLRFTNGLRRSCNINVRWTSWLLVPNIAFFIITFKGTCQRWKIVKLLLREPAL